MSLLQEKEEMRSSAQVVLVLSKRRAALFIILTEGMENMDKDTESCVYWIVGS